VTERAIFKCTEAGVELIEIAAGVDLQQNILAQMDFRPAISPSLREMDPRLFQPEPMGLRHDLAGRSRKIHPRLVEAGLA
jgi:propionate CoA-transferase